MMIYFAYPRMKNVGFSLRKRLNLDLVRTLMIMKMAKQNRVESHCVNLTTNLIAPNCTGMDQEGLFVDPVVDSPEITGGSGSRTLLTFTPVPETFKQAS